MNIRIAAVEGMQRAERSLERTASRLARLPLAPDLQEVIDQVSFSQQMVALLLARNAFAASARVAHTADEIEKHVLDLIA